MRRMEEEGVRMKVGGRGDSKNEGQNNNENVAVPKA